MLVLELIGVVLLAALVVRWKRARLPLLLLLLLGLLLQRIHCSHDARIKPYDTVCQDPLNGCTDPGGVVDAGTTVDAGPR